ncbi:MAG: DUF4349 domain-containing protein [Coprococcus catus]|nr:DUF4349 domain-containing protein [Coprococcus catus]
MTEKEVEKAYKKMTESDAPDLWAKIESNLPEKEVRTEKKVRTGFFAKLGKIFSGGSTWKTSAAVCAVCIIVLGTAQGAGGMFRAGASNGTASAASKSSYGMDAYSVDGAEAYSAEGDGEKAAPADYNGMNYAAAAAGTGADADSSGGAVVLSENEASADEAGTAENGKEMANSADTENGQSSRKLIRTFNLDAETTDFDNLVTQLQQETQNLGGYVESSYVNGNSYYTENSRYASLTLRLPKDKTNDFLGTVGEMANVTSKSENVEDVTLTYTDLKSHVEALQAEQEQLMKLMEQAKTVEDTMSIQSRLTDVRYELESYMSQLKVYDNQVDYDTVNISIQEVKNETPTGELSIGQKMLNGLENSLRAIAESAKNLCIWFVASIPYFVILFAVIFAVVSIIKKIRKKK